MSLKSQYMSGRGFLSLKRGSDTGGILSLKQNSDRSLSLKKKEYHEEKVVGGGAGEGTFDGPIPQQVNM